MTPPTFHGRVEPADLARQLSKEFAMKCDSPPAALTIVEAARQLSVCRATVYRMIAVGEIRAVKIRNATRIPRTEIERIVAGGES